MHRTAWAVVSALVLAAALVVGCAPPDDQAEPTATATPTATSTPERTPTASPTPTGVRTGVSSTLDAIVQAALAGDTARLEQMTKLTPMPCGPQQGPGSPPACPPGQPDGTPVEVLPVVTCEGELRPRQHVRASLEMLTTASPRLEGVYRVPPGYLPHAPGEHMAVFSRQDRVSGTLGAGLLVNGGGIVALVYGCQADPTQIAPPGSQPVLLPGG